MTLPLLVLFATTAVADEDGGIFSGLGYAGDGVTPSMLEYTERQNPQLLQAGHVGEAGERGDFGYSVPIGLQPALFSPQVSLSYSSSGGVHNRIGRGWSLNAGMSIKALTPREQGGAYADHQGLYRVTGGGLSGLLELSDDDLTYDYVSSSSTYATAEYDSDVEQWTVFAGGQQWTLEPRFPESTAPQSWQVTHASDASGNAIDWTYTGTRLDTVVYGGNQADLAQHPHTARVRFTYESRPTSQRSRSFNEGFEEQFAVRLTEVLVDARDEASSVWSQVSTWALDPVTVAGSQRGPDLRVHVGPHGSGVHGPQRRRSTGLRGHARR